MAELNDTRVIENPVETEQTLLNEQPEGKKSVMLSVVKGNYVRKTAKCNRKIEKFQDSILILTTDKHFLESKISELENKINIENAAVTAFCNSNNFLESVKGQSFRIDSVLIFLTFNNNRKMIEKGRKTERLKTEIKRIKSQI